MTPPPPPPCRQLLCCFIIVDKTTLPRPSPPLRPSSPVRRPTILHFLFLCRNFLVQRAVHWMHLKSSTYSSHLLIPPPITLVYLPKMPLNLVPGLCGVTLIMGTMLYALLPPPPPLLCPTPPNSAPFFPPVLLLYKWMEPRLLRGVVVLLVVAVVAVVPVLRSWDACCCSRCCCCWRAVAATAELVALARLSIRRADWCSGNGGPLLFVLLAFK